MSFHSPLHSSAVVSPSKESLFSSFWNALMYIFGSGTSSGSYHISANSADFSRYPVMPTKKMAHPTYSSTSPSWVEQSSAYGHEDRIVTNQKALHRNPAKKWGYILPRPRSSIIQKFQNSLDMDRSSRKDRTGDTSRRSKTPAPNGPREKPRYGSFFRRKMSEVLSSRTSSLSSYSFEDELRTDVDFPNTLSPTDVIVIDPHDFYSDLDTTTKGEPDAPSDYRIDNSNQYFRGSVPDSSSLYTKEEGVPDYDSNSNATWFIERWQKQLLVEEGVHHGEESHIPVEMADHLLELREFISFDEQDLAAPDSFTLGVRASVSSTSTVTHVRTGTTGALRLSMVESKRQSFAPPNSSHNRFSNRVSPSLRENRTKISTYYSRRSCLSLSNQNDPLMKDVLDALRDPNLEDGWEEWIDSVMGRELISPRDISGRHKREIYQDISGNVIAFQAKQSSDAPPRNASVRETSDPYDFSSNFAESMPGTNQWQWCDIINLDDYVIS